MRICGMVKTLPDMVSLLVKIVSRILLASSSTCVLSKTFSRISLTLELLFILLLLALDRREFFCTVIIKESLMSSLIKVVVVSLPFVTSLISLVSRMSSDKLPKF